MSKYLDVRLVMLMDMILSILVSALVLLSGFFLTKSDIIPHSVFCITWMAASVAGTGLMFYVIKTYRIIIRHTSFKDILKFGIVLTGKVLIMLCALLVFSKVNRLVVIMLFFDALMSIIVLVGVRLLMIAVYDLYKSRIREMQKCKRVLVYGTSDKTEAVISRFRNSPHYEVVGVISPDTSLKKAKFSDKTICVFENESDVDKAALSLSCNAILFTRMEDARLEDKRLVKYCTHPTRHGAMPTI